jgi:hypothetical protein
MSFLGYGRMTFDLRTRKYRTVAAKTYENKWRDGILQIPLRAGCAGAREAGVTA